MTITQEELDTFSHAFCMPVTLLINFALFQYLASIYYKRRKETRGALVLICAFGGFATLVPFSYPNGTVVGHLNDISETCSTLTFLVQIAIIGRDINKKVKIATLKYLTFVAEGLVLFGLIVVAQNVIEVLFPHIEAPDGLDNIMEDIALWFIFFFRFTMLIMARGYRFVLENKKFEVMMYLLFVTHEYPFVILEAETGLPWEDMQALWNRLTIALCVMITIQEKLRSRSSKLSKLTSAVVTKGPSTVEKPSAGRAAVAVPAAMKTASRMLSFCATVKPAGPAGIRVGPHKPAA